MAAQPPLPITKLTKATPDPKKNKKGKKKCGASGLMNRLCGTSGTPVKIAKSGSFRRVAGFNRCQLSPLAKAVRTRRKKAPSASAETDKAPEKVPSASADSEPQPTAEEIAGKIRDERQDYETLITHLQGLGIPEDALPEHLPRGAKSYTKHHHKHAGSVQVLHSRGIFYVNTDRDGIVPKTQTFSWDRNGGAEPTWKFIKTYLKW